MLTPLVLLIVGFVVLMWSADRFVFGASHLAYNLKVSPMLIGLTIVALGTSAPEVVVSIIAAIQGFPEMALGNAIGSNIANIGLVVGTTAIISPMLVESQTLRKEFPLLFAITLLTIILMSDAALQVHDGIILMLGMVCLMSWFILSAKRTKDDRLSDEYKKELRQAVSTQTAVVWLLIGLILLPLSSHYLIVNNAVAIAEYFQVSQTFIGLTLIAIGTSLPEVATSAMGVLKGEHDIALGNVIGSNMFNMLVVLSLPALISPFPIENMVLWRDLPIMSALTLLLFLMAYGRNGTGKIGRLKGTCLLSLYIAYLTWLVMSA